jgi:SAM-dependent methyltransferase
MDVIEKIARIGQTYTQKTLYNTMHIAHPGYRHRNQGIAEACDWLHLLRDKRGEVHNPWSNTPITVVELGCGNGKLCNLLASLRMDVTGVDIFDNDAVYDRWAYKFIQHDLTKTPYPFGDNEFDYCLSFDVMEHLPEECAAPALQEMARISRAIIVGISCTGRQPLHLTVKSPGWWLDQLTENCHDFSWRLLRNHERIRIGGEEMARSVEMATDIRPLPGGDTITYAPLFYGKRGVIAGEG